MTTERSTCPDCKGAGSLPAPSFSLGICTRCNGAGCDHHAAWTTKVPGGHCALCEQDDACRACQRQQPVPKPTEDETFDPDALKED